MHRNATLIGNLMPRSWVAEPLATVQETVLMVARQMALAIAGGKKPRHNSLTRTDRLESSFEAKQVISMGGSRVAWRTTQLEHRTS